MRKWILFGALMLGLVQLEWGLERWASRAAPGSDSDEQMHMVGHQYISVYGAVPIASRFLGASGGSSDNPLRQRNTVRD